MYYYINMYKITSVKHCLDFCVVVVPPAHEYYFYLEQKLLCAFRTDSEGNPESV